MSFNTGVNRVDAQAKFDIDLRKATPQFVASQLSDWIAISLDTENVEGRVIIRIQIGMSADE